MREAVGTVLGFSDICDAELSDEVVDPATRAAIKERWKSIPHEKVRNAMRLLRII